MAKPFNIRWGYMAFARDMLIDPSLRGASDISHTISAVASSSSRESAQKFISDISIPQPCAAYGSYEDLVNDPNVDIVYIATPHSHHFQNTMLALNAGKHVLCEKALTVNAAQARILVETARQKKLFLMEAVWTRFFPISVQIRELIRKGEIGEVLRVIADTSCGSTDPEGEWGTTHRMVNLDLAGGVLLDVGVYSLTWVFQTLYHTRPLAQRKPPSSISSQMVHYHATGADESTTILLEFPQSTPAGTHKAQAVAMTNFRLISDPDGKWSAGPSVRIQGTRGEIQVFGYPFHPDSFKVIPLMIAGETGDERQIREVVGEFPGNGAGMYWEADEAARCVMDEVRRQGGLRYPDEIESTEYPVKLGPKKSDV
ncbi:hypothetical protein ACJ72_03948 [Emergomyces africanus]|uniref:D-xylose 1-dehydrogenase (NADP(+), D-xylono-1,5-lactone-forming) n=1 Tax=Emergomyces africanus TaxID=1955775 RepID=A0A1B7NY52_9EURO|nr:hypothetical protein ACJ72_03948 [Emergomyces africanus]